MGMGWILTNPEAHVGPHPPHCLVLIVHVSDLVASTAVRVENGCWSHAIGVHSSLPDLLSKAQGPVERGTSTATDDVPLIPTVSHCANDNQQVKGKVHIAPTIISE
jgi:hypothetical protein